MTPNVNLDLVGLRVPLIHRLDQGDLFLILSSGAEVGEPGKPAWYIPLVDAIVATPAHSIFDDPELDRDETEEETRHAMFRWGKESLQPVFDMLQELAGVPLVICPEPPGDDLIAYRVARSPFTSPNQKDNT